MIKRTPSWYRFHYYLAYNRTPFTIIFGAISSLFLGVFMYSLTKPHWLSVLSFIVFIMSTVLSVFISFSPRRYERIQIASNLLPIIFNVLKLDKTSRITIHHIINIKDHTYEQITDYHPTMNGRGRRFDFTQGITGQVFKTRRPQIYEIPIKSDIKYDYQHRWSFTEDEISRLTQDRRSFYAYPVGQEGQYAKTVVYFDSAKQDMFTEKVKEKYDKKMKEIFLPILEELLFNPKKPEL